MGRTEGNNPGVHRIRPLLVLQVSHQLVPATNGKAKKRCSPLGAVRYTPYG
ncbi:hypothetical protein OC195_18740 [Priestia flexa]|nr:hypothetical protein OC195_18740 [Priestia flexa]